MKEWLDAQCNCTHCGNPLEMRPAKRDDGFTIKGFEPMEYRHVHDKRKICVSFGEAHPYDNSRKYERYLNTLKALESEQ